MGHSQLMSGCAAVAAELEDDLFGAADEAHGTGEEPIHRIRRLQKQKQAAQLEERLRRRLEGKYVALNTTQLLAALFHIEWLS